MIERTQNEALDAGPRKSAPGTRRFCAASGQEKSVHEMIRFVIGPCGAAVPDLKRRLPGRGIWVTATRQALQTAVDRNAFARGFKRKVHAGADLVDTTELLLEQAALDALAICHKAGRVAIGFGKVEAALAGGRVVGLLHAQEGAAAGREQLAGALNRRADAGKIPVICTFTSAQLDLALGRSNVIHAALLAGPESHTFLARAARLDCFRAVPMSGSTGVRKHGSRKIGQGRRAGE